MQTNPTHTPSTLSLKNTQRNAMRAVAMVAAMLAAGSPLRASDADDRIESAFEKSYVSKTYLKDDKIKADADEGVLTLTGTVAADAHRSLAGETAAGLPGVTRVDNKLETKAEVAADNADAWIGRKAKLALLFHRNVNASHTDIAVKDGVVTLTGEASSLAQKELTAEYAGDIEGVKSVKNELRVKASPDKAEPRTTGEKLDDASITAQVKTALLTHRSTSSVKTMVVTREGEVTLTGIAANAAEVALVTKLVTDIQGVTSVKNQMTLAVAANP